MFKNNFESHEEGLDEGVTLQFCFCQEQCLYQLLRSLPAVFLCLFIFILSPHLLLDLPCCPHTQIVSSFLVDSRPISDDHTFWDALPSTTVYSQKFNQRCQKDAWLPTKVGKYFLCKVSKYTVTKHNWYL